MIDLEKQTSAEVEAIQKAVMQREGLILDILTVLRRIPRRVLMVLKLNDLTRSLDHALATTHSGVRLHALMLVQMNLRIDVFGVADPCVPRHGEVLCACGMGR